MLKARQTDYATFLAFHLSTAGGPATQNPIEQEGTYPLPEAQVDRFMLKVIIKYPQKEEEKKILRQNIAQTFPETRALISPEDIIKAKNVFFMDGI